jgi:formate C-acetyltransferase
MEIVNIGAVSFPAAVDHAIRAGLAAEDNFEGILDRVAKNIDEQVHQLGEAYSRLWLPPAPYYSVFMEDCLEQGKDLSDGLKYNNFGIHGACAANAADALAAVKQFLFEDLSLSSSEILSALDGNYTGYESMRQKLLDEGPKVGNNDTVADTLLVKVFNDLADSCERYGHTPRGGILRPGTGSAMYYIWLATGHPGMREPVIGASADGRLRGEPFSANLSPALGVRVRGPISMLQSFAKIDYQRICNGGPITMELSDTVFRNPESIRKTAMLVRTFAQLGCQQLQLNSLNLDTLLDAKAHPENHKNLIVRVWGWSGYFCELAPEYQDQIIARHYFE